MLAWLIFAVQYVVTVNVETERNEEGVMFRYWSNIMSDEQAAQLARTMADVLESFVNRPEQTIAELDPPKERIETQIIVQAQPQPPTIHTHHTIVQPQVQPQTIHTHHTVVHNQVVPTPVLDNNATLKKMVSECVQQVIGEMIKSGLLLPRTAENASIPQQEQHVIHSTDDESDVNSPVVLKPKIQLDPYHFVGKETNVRRSMARQLSKRGRSAATEKKLLAVWSLMLDMPEDSISGEDSFFELGGDSITAMKLVGAARDEGLTLTVADVFRHPTFDDMAAIIRVASMMSTFITDADLNEYNEYNAHNNAIHQMPESELYERFSLVKASNIDAFLQSSICPKVGVFKGGIADVLPVTDFQSLAITGTLLESRWMLNYFYLDGAGALDLRLLKQSCFRLVQAFDILRTVFLPSGDRFLQVVLRKMRPDFQVFETEQDLDEFTAMLQQNDRDQGPRLGEPFVQFTVAKQKDSDRHRIFVRISHAQYDGVCLPRILAALHSGYQLEPIPPTPSFADYVRASASTVTSDHYQHWKSLLKGSFMTEIVRRDGPNYRRSAGATMSLKENVHLPSVAHGNITTATVIKSAWALVLAQLSARSDVVFGHTISGRNAGVPGVENIIGPCLNLVPVRVQFEAQWTALDLLRYVQDQQVANMPYEAIGFREITKHCTEWPDWTNFTTAVQHQNVDRGREMQLGDNMYKVGAAGTDEDFADFSILSTPLEESDMVEIRLSFSLNGVISTAFAEQVLGMLCSAAENFTASPNTTLPSPHELSSLPRQAVDDVAAGSDELFQSNQLQNLSRAELLVLSDILSRAWRQVLRNDKGEGDGNGGAENLQQLDNSFFELGGDIMGLAQVAWLLEQEGFKLRVEDLIDHPTMLGHMAVLGLHIASERQKAMDSHAPLSGAPTPDRALVEGREPLMLSRVGKSRTFGKAVGLAKRMVKKNARSHR
jgi:aryl carrier-like protein